MCGTPGVEMHLKNFFVCALGRNYVIIGYIKGQVEGLEKRCRKRFFFGLT